MERRLNDRKENKKTDPNAKKPHFSRFKNYFRAAGLGLMLVAGTNVFAQDKPKKDNIQKEEKSEEQKKLDNEFLEAVKNGHIKKAKELLKKGANIEYKKNPLGATPLLIACKNNDFGMVKILVEKGANVNSCTNTLLAPPNPQNHTSMTTTPLILASENGNTKIAKMLIENGAEVNITNYGEDTPLTIAAENDDIKMVKLLVKNGADVNSKKPLNKAAKNGNMEITKFLIDKGADVNSGAIMDACWKGHTEIVKLLIEKGADVNIYMGNTPLTAAASKGNVNLVKLLLENGADTNIKGYKNSTALGHAKEKYSYLKNNKPDDLTKEEYKQKLDEYEEIIKILKQHKIKE